MQNTQNAELDLGEVTPEQLAAYLAAEPQAHFVLRSEENGDSDPRSPIFWQSVAAPEQIITDDWQNPMRLILLLDKPLADQPSAECVYCHALISDASEVPALTDDAAWERLAVEHGAQCEWILTRAHRRD